MQEESGEWDGGGYSVVQVGEGLSEGVEREWRDDGEGLESEVVASGSGSGSGSGDGNGEKERKRVGKGKLRRSCEWCRKFKVRCLASPNEGDEDSCQRCLKGGRKCVFLEGKRRPKKVREARLRVDEMEQKIESLMALVTSGAQAGKKTSDEETLPSSRIQSLDIPAFVPLRFSTTPQTQYPPKVPKFQPFETYPFSIPTTLPFSIFDDIQDVISKGTITYEKAEQSIRHFRTTASSFPFIIIPSEASLDHLRRNKPFLLLAILAMAANDNMKLQKALDQEFRDTLGRRVFVSGERSLDLLQGILLYLAWHHFFFEPDHQQIYQLCQSAVSMAIDLEITRPEKNRRQNPSNSFNLLSVIAESNCLTKLNSSQAEAKRAFLGCYYLSSTLCIGLRKPNNMKHTSYTDECCQVLAAGQEFESDSLIPYFVQLQKLADDINRTFDYDGHQEVASLDSFRIEMFVERFRQQLNQLEKSFLAEVWKHDMLTMAFYNLRTFINEIGFHKSPPSPIDILSAQSNSHAWHSSLARTDILLNCLSTAKNYLDRYLSLSTEILFTSTFPDYAKLVYNILVLKLFATWDSEGDEGMSLDKAQIRKNVNMAGYMEALVRKFELLGKVGKEKGLVEDYTVYLVRLFQTYEGRAREGVGAMGGEFSDGVMDMSVMQVLPVYDTKLPPGEVVEQMHENTAEHWDDMINGWSPTAVDLCDLGTDTIFT